MFPPNRNSLRPYFSQIISTLLTRMHSYVYYPMHAQDLHVILTLHTAESKAKAVLDGGGNGKMGRVEDSAINVMVGNGEENKNIEGEWEQEQGGTGKRARKALLLFSLTMEENEIIFSEQLTAIKSNEEVYSLIKEHNGLSYF
jgi:hypothetical protein